MATPTKNTTQYYPWHHFVLLPLAFLMAGYAITRYTKVAGDDDQIARLWFTVAALAIIGLGVLAACSSSQNAPPPAAEGGERIACALAGAQAFADDCAVDRMDAGGALSLVVRHPDGSFRRFAVVKDGRGLVVADGAEQARTSLQDDKLAVTVGQDRYLFPAKIKSPAVDAKP